MSSMVWEPLPDGQYVAEESPTWPTVIDIEGDGVDVSCLGFRLRPSYRLCRQVPATDAPVALPDGVREALDTVLTNCEVDMEMEAFDGDYAVQMAAAIKLLRRLMDEETTADAPPVG